MDDKKLNDREAAQDQDAQLQQLLDGLMGGVPDEQGSAEEIDLDQLLSDAKKFEDTDGAGTEDAQAAEQAVMESIEPFQDESYREIFGEGEELRRIFDDTQSSPREPKKRREDKKASVQDIPEEEPAEEISMRKGRPKRKDQYGMLGIPHLLVTCFWLVIVLAIGVSIGRVIWVCASDVLAFGREEKIVEVRIDTTDSMEDIAQKLHDAGLIRYPGLFKLYAGFSDAREEISAGNFKLNTIYDYHALVDSMSSYSSSAEEVTVLIPEGYSCAQIFALMEENGVCNAEELESYAKDGELADYWFLKDVKRGDKYCLEGFLFPDTYEFYENTSAKRVLKKLLDNFEHRFTEEMQASIDTLNEEFASRLRNNGYGDEYIQEHKLSVRDVVTIASLIEKETAGNQESPNISSVIYNRLSDQDKWPYLNIDAALLYAIGHREVISAEDKEIDTPYNTYKYPGLVPGPIANPGVNSLNAALHPSDTSYYFYALDPESGAHHFSETYDEHNAFLEGLGE